MGNNNIMKNDLKSKKNYTSWNFMSTGENAVIIEPKQAHRASVIWLHGLGASGHDFEPMVPELHLPDRLGIRFIFPHAPVRPVTINGGMSMRAWYDVRHMDLRRQEDPDSIESSKNIVNRYIDAELQRGIEPGRIIIAGFSQGGAIALHTGLRFAQRLAGLLVLSAYLPLPERLSAEANPANDGLPILMLHGMYDQVIPLSAARQSCDTLRRAGYPVDWQDYPMEHSVCLEEVQDISRWLLSVLE